jgi:hypothetical protein
LDDISTTHLKPGRLTPKIKKIATGKVNRYAGSCVVSVSAQTIFLTSILGKFSHTAGFCKHRNNIIFVFHAVAVKIVGLG